MKETIYYFNQFVSPQNSANVIMAGISYCDASYRIERSNYDAYVIEYVLDGEGVLEVDGNKYNLSAKDTYFLYGGKGHKYYCKKNHWVKIWVVISGELTDALFHAYLPEKPNVIRGVDLENNMQRIIELTGNKGLSYEELCNQVMILIHKILISVKDCLNTDTADLAERIKNHIDENLDKPLHLNNAAALFHYSKNHLINCFRLKYGITPYTYFENQRMLVAQELLRNTQDSILGISVKLGFENPQYFAKCFKKHFTLTPSQYRKLYR